MANKFKKNDNVIVISGSDKGKIGKILSIDGNRVIVEGANLVTFHKKPTSNQAGEIIKKERATHISNISHIEDGKATKVTFEISQGDGKDFTRKKRISVKTKKRID
ncbi:MAG: large subunit ribosomal protein L24 [Lentimonas sp.]|jgi:large subunit ribosomal protein L24